MTQIDICKKEFREYLLAKLPPVIARKDVKLFLGGMVSSKTLANADSLGEGPTKAYKVGKTIVYTTEGLVDWLISNTSVRQLNNNLTGL